MEMCVLDVVFGLGNVAALIQYTCKTVDADIGFAITAETLAQEVCKKKVLYTGSNFQAKAFRPPPPYYMQYGILTISMGNSHFQLSAFGYLNKISATDRA
jgi:hypothetical protein